MDTTLELPRTHAKQALGDATARSTPTTKTETLETRSVDPSNPPETPKKPKRAAKVFLGLGAVALLGGGGHFALTAGRETTDDAQLEGHIVNVAPRVAGQVEEVLVQDNQRVRVGDVLVRLDTRDLDARLLAAHADAEAARAALAASRAELALTQANTGAQVTAARGGLTQARAQLVGTSSSIAEADAAVESARSASELAATELARAEQLRGSGAIADAELDAKASAARQSAAAFAQAKARRTQMTSVVSGWNGAVAEARGRLAEATTGPEQVSAAQAKVAQAEARVAQAEASERLAALDVEHATVRAPIDGIVSRKSVEPGQMASPDRPLLSLVGTDEVWVVANFKEDQIAHMRTGQKVRLSIDAYDGEIEGRVESLAAATGSRFSLLPPDNAAGNFTKVVQRVPVRIHVDGRHDGRLLPGLNVIATVDTRGH